jgi:hypothetical protein
MIFWSLCAFIWFRNMKKMLLQMTSMSLQPVPSLEEFIAQCYVDRKTFEDNLSRCVKLFRETGGVPKKNHRLQQLQLLK